MLTVLFILLGASYGTVLVAKIYLVWNAEPDPIPYVYSDGGRKQAGYRKKTGDCVTRAIALATGLPYAQAHERVDSMCRLTGRFQGHESAEKGIFEDTAAHLMHTLGATYHGCPTDTYLKRDTLPGGNLIVHLEGHVMAVIDGVAYDNHKDNGKRKVYGHWKFPERTS